MVIRRPVLVPAMLAYALSFALAAVSLRGPGIPGYQCAYYAFVTPLLTDSVFIGKKTVVYIAFLLTGWINIVFLAALAMRWWEGNREPFEILRIMTLLMIPFCWIVFYDAGLYPREGHVLWVVGMVVALFSDRRLSVIAGSQP